MTASILLTGATGFVGGAILKNLCRQGYPVVTVSRAHFKTQGLATEAFHIDTLDGHTQWQDSLSGVEVVIHSAARVHVMHDNADDPLAAFRNVNVEGTLNLARQAAAAGVRRLIYISSIKVNGEGTRKGQVYRADDAPAPVDPYGISKREAEEGLMALARSTSLEVVIIRPVLVYGPGVKANFLTMMKWLEKGIPLPLGAIDNRRSMVALDNLVDLVRVCVSHPAAANQTFLVSDGEDLSTTSLLKKISIALGKQPRLLPVPLWMLELFARLLGKRALSQRLGGSLQVDIEKTRILLGWEPPVGVDEALAKTARHFKENP